MRRLFFLFFLTLSLPLASQQWYFWIDEYHPAMRPYLQSSASVLLVNNTVEQPEDFGHSVAVDGVAMGNETISLTDAALHCLFTATQTMDETLAFDRVELLDKSQNTSGSYYVRQTMSLSDKQALCQEHHVDALVILNQLVLYNILESFPVDQTYMASLQACAQAHWTIYRHKDNRDYTFTTSDTLYWESAYAYSREVVLRQLPTTQEALLYLAREVGAGAAASLLPQWKSVKRYLYTHDDKTITQGLTAFQYQRWKDAISIWMPLLEQGKKKTAAMAAANIAIAWEMSGDYALAYDYAEKAYDLFGAWKTADGRQQQVNIRYYLEQLQDKMAMQVGQ